MTLGSRFSLALLLAFGALCTANAQEVPVNNLCDSATEVTTFPFYATGSLANATQDSLNISCYGGWVGIDVWYVFPDVSEGTEMFGIGGEVQGWVLKSNNELGTCPEVFLCPKLLTATSSIDSSGSTQSRLIWTAEKNSFYYLALFSTSNTTGPDFEVSVDTIAPIPSPTPIGSLADPSTTSRGFKKGGLVGVTFLVSMGVLTNVMSKSCCMLPSITYHYSLAVGYFEATTNKHHSRS